MTADFGFIDGKAPRNPGFRQGLESEMNRLREFLKSA
jgi:hypothetical protein